MDSLPCCAGPPMRARSVPADRAIQRHRHGAVTRNRGRPALSPEPPLLWQSRVMHPRLFALALAGLAAAAPAVSRADDMQPVGQRVAGDDALRTLLIGHTFYGLYVGGGRWIEYYSPDGRSAYWDGCTHDGRWWIANGHACFRYRGDVQNADYCWLVYQSGSEVDFVVPDDDPTGPGARLHDGDPARQQRKP